MREFLIFAVLIVALSAQGCTEAVVATGIEATNLSEVRPGISRERVEKVLGPPIESAVFDRGKLDTYKYDMGMAPHPKGWAHPSLIYPEGCDAGMLCLAGLLLYAGAQPYLIEKMHEAQEGRLTVKYGPDDTVVELAVDTRKTGRGPGIQELLALATGGDAEAQFKIYQRTRNADRWRWLCLSANEGYAPAQDMVSVAYKYGLESRQEDFTQAYMWASLAAGQGHIDAAERRDDLATKMTAVQLAEGKQLVAEWKPDPSLCGADPVAITKTGISATASPTQQTPLCRDVGGYEAYMKRTGKVCRLN